MSYFYTDYATVFKENQLQEESTDKKVLDKSAFGKSDGWLLMLKRVGGLRDADWPKSRWERPEEKKL